MLIITDLFGSFLNSLPHWVVVAWVACTALFVGMCPGCCRSHASRREGSREGENGHLC